MTDGSDTTGLGVIVGILVAVVVIVLAIGVGPRFLRTSASSPVSVTIEAPKVPTPVAPKG